MRIAAKLAHPESVTQDDDIAAVGHVFLRRKRPAQPHARAEEPEVCLGHVRAFDLLRNTAGQVQPFTAEVVRSHVLEDAGLLLPHVELGHRGARAAMISAIGKQELDDAIGLRIGERFQQHRVDHGKDGGVGPDSERQRGHYGEGETGVPEKHAQGVANVGEECGHENLRGEDLGNGPSRLRKAKVKSSRENAC